MPAERRRQRRRQRCFFKVALFLERIFGAVASQHFTPLGFAQVD